MIVGFPPFYTGNKRNTQMFKNMKKEPNRRLGHSKGFNEVLEHCWISDNIDHEKVKEKSIDAPFIPDLDENNILDLQNFDSEFTTEEVADAVIPQSEQSKI